MIEARTFIRRGKEIVLWEIVGLFASKEGEILSDQEWATILNRVPFDKVRMLLDLRQFESQSWRFVYKQEDDVIRVLVNNNVVLCPNTFVINFNEEMQSGDEETFLNKYDCEIIEKLEFGFNMYRVKSSGNVFNTINELDGLMMVEFVEPELIEVIGYR